MAWSLAAIEFVAWSVLQEDGSGEEVAEKALEEAWRANAFVAWNIAHREIFDEVGKGPRWSGFRVLENRWMCCPPHTGAQGG